MKKMRKDKAGKQKGWQWRHKTQLGQTPFVWRSTELLVCDVWMIVEFLRCCFFFKSIAQTNL